MQHSLLAIYAHPDDEAFGTGGTIARYASQGVKVYLICATRGEAGEISDPSLATPDTLGCVREDELRCAAETMGITDLVFLDYRDSGMVGTPENKDSRAFINAPAPEVINKLVSYIRNWRPEIIVTFEPNGGYGHPDHIAIHRHTLAAFHAAADPSYFPDLGLPWQASRLFYTVIPRAFFRELRLGMIDSGLDTHELDSFEKPEYAWPDEAINVQLDVSSTVESKWQALACHRTQFGPGNLFRRLPEDRVKRLMGLEYFALAWPEPTEGLRLPSLIADLA